MNNSYKTNKSSGFTLLELLVVVAILGIISSIGVLSYTGYVSSAKQKSVENIMMQASLGQTEYYSENGSYYYDKSGSDCDVSSAKSDLIEENLLGGTDSINDKIEYNFCVSSSGADYKIKAEQIKGTCKITMDKNNVFTRTDC